MNTPVSDTFRQQLQAMRADVLAQLRAQRGGKIGRIRMYSVRLR